MNTLRTICESDDSGTVRIDLPVHAPHRRVEVVVVWEEVGNEGGRSEPMPTKLRTPEELGWPPGFFEKFPGIFADDPISRGEQGVVEEIPSIDLDR
jgi:hypothetical protein